VSGQLEHWNGDERAEILIGLNWLRIFVLVALNRRILALDCSFKMQCLHKVHKINT